MKKNVVILVLVTMLACAGSASAMTLLWKITAPNGDSVGALGFSPHGNRLVAGTATGRMSIFDITSEDAKTWSVKPVFDGKGSTSAPVESVAFDPMQQLLAIGSRDGYVRFSDRSGTLLHEYSFGVPVRQIVFSTDGSRAMVLCASSTVKIVDTKTYDLRDYSYKYYRPIAIAFGASDNEIVEGMFNAKGELVKGNIDNNKATLKTYAHQFGVTAMAVCAANNSIVSAGQDGFIKLWALDSLQSTGQIAVQDIIDCLALTSDGNTIVGQCHDGSIKIWDAIDCIQTDVIYYKSTIQAMALCPNRRLIAAAYNNGDVCVYSY